MITIDTDVKIEKIHVYPLPDGMKATFELRDASNPSTEFFLTFYKKQVDYIMKRFYEVDLRKVKEKLRLEFLKREQIAIKGLREELDELRMEYSILVDQLETEREEQDAKTNQ